MKINKWEVIYLDLSLRSFALTAASSLKLGREIINSGGAGVMYVNDAVAGRDIIIMLSHVRDIVISETEELNED